MTTTAAQRTAAHAAFVARRKYVNEVCEQLGCTQDSCSNWRFPSEAAEDAFESLMDSYDVRVNSQLAALDAVHGAPLVTTRRMAVATLCDDIEHAEGLTAANQVVLDTLVSEGRALPHHHARLAFDNAAIDIMYQQHATLLGRSLDDRA